jgi:hypothetical protein
MTLEDESRVSASRYIRQSCNGCDFMYRTNTIREGLLYNCRLKSADKVLEDFSVDGDCTDAKSRGRNGVVAIQEGFVFIDLE